MKDELISRILTLANHIHETHDTIRKTAQIYGLSKSTVHNDVSIKLKKIDFSYYKKIKKILNENFSEKHIRGGQATKIKYSKKSIKN